MQSIFRYLKLCRRDSRMWQTERRADFDVAKAAGSRRCAAKNRLRFWWSYCRKLLSTFWDTVGKKSLRSQISKCVNWPRLFVVLKTSQFFADDLRINVVVLQFSQELAVPHPRAPVAVLVEPVAVCIVSISSLLTQVHCQLLANCLVRFAF